MFAAVAHIDLPTCNEAAIPTRSSHTHMIYSPIMLRAVIVLASSAVTCGFLLRAQSRLLRRPACRRAVALTAARSSGWTVAPDDAVRVAVSDDSADILLKSWDEDVELCAYDGVLQHEPHVHWVDGLESHGAIVYASSTTKGPGILLVHTAVGPQDLFLRWRAEALASRGYVVLIADLLGDPLGKGWDPTFAAPRRQVYIDDRPLLARRTHAALSSLAALPMVDARRLAAVGYCFGGRAVVDLIKLKPHGLQGVVSFHGVVDDEFSPDVVARPSSSEDAPRALLCHADADPFVPRARLDACIASLSHLGIVWELQTFGGDAKHGFTNPAQAINPRSEFRYDPIAERSSWAASKAFLADVLGSGHELS